MLCGADALNQEFVPPAWLLPGSMLCAVLLLATIAGRVFAGSSTACHEGATRHRVCALAVLEDSVGRQHFASALVGLHFTLYVNPVAIDLFLLKAPPA